MLIRPVQFPLWLTGLAGQGGSGWEFGQVFDAFGPEVVGLAVEVNAVGREHAGNFFAIGREECVTHAYVLRAIGWRGSLYLLVDLVDLAVEVQNVGSDGEDTEVEQGGIGEFVADGVAAGDGPGGDFLGRGVGQEVVNADQQCYKTRPDAVENAVANAPEDVLGLVAADAVIEHSGALYLALEFAHPRAGVGDGVAQQKQIDVASEGGEGLCLRELGGKCLEPPGFESRGRPG